MLVLSRKINEVIRIGRDITITIVKIGSRHVQVGIDAPTHVTVDREEISIAKTNQNFSLDGDSDPR